MALGASTGLIQRGVLLDTVRLALGHCGWDYRIVSIGASDFVVPFRHLTVGRRHLCCHGLDAGFCSSAINPSPSAARIEDHLMSALRSN